MTGIAIELDNVGVATDDFAASLDFYVERLGLPIQDQDDSVPSAVLDAGGTQLYLFGTNGSPGPSRDADFTNNHTGIDHLSFTVEDVDSSYEALRDAGVDFFLRPTDTEWGARMCGCNDPGGALVYLLTWQG